jgi:hypothetical protein
MTPTTPYEYMMPLGIAKNVLTADGCQDIMTRDWYYCCPPPLCGNDLCCTLVAFFNLLPSGPLWDYWKRVAIDYFQVSDDVSQCPLVKDPKCPSLVLHVIYTVLKLRSYVHGPLWVSFRESDPTTVLTTMDYWLERLKWEDCYLQHCRSVLLGDLTPYEVMGECGPIFCPPDFPPELICAVKHNIIIALSRAQMGIIKNQCAINWVIEPLGAAIKSRYTIKPDQDLPLNPLEPCDSPCDEDMALEICNTKDWIYGCDDGDVCTTQETPPKIQAYWDWPCAIETPAGLPQRIWPAVLAAECIVRSMLPSNCPNNIFRCC